MSLHNLLWGALAVAAYLIAQALFDRRQRRRKGAMSVSTTSTSRGTAKASKPRLFSGKRLAVVVVVLVAGTLGSFVYDDLTRPGTSPATAKSPLPPVSDAEPIMESFVQQMRTTFGPFETIVVSKDTPTSELHFPAVLMMYQDGRTDASTRWTISPPTLQWTRANTAPVVGVSVKEDRVVFQADFDRIFVVRVSQPFILETRPTEVYVFDALGNAWVLGMMQAAAMRQPL